MPEKPVPGRENPGDIACPHCTIRIPAGVPECPFCRGAVGERNAGGRAGFGALIVEKDRFSAFRNFYWEHRKGLKVLLPVFLSVLILWQAFGLLTRVKIVIPQDNTFLIEAERERKEGGATLLKGKLTNRGDDIPDLSLRSIGVIVEFLYGDGKTERKSIFPKSPFRGEGALLRGESGAFEIDVPKEVKSVTLRGEIVDLGERRVFDSSSRGIRRLPMQNKR